MAELMPERYRSEKGMDRKVKLKGTVQFIVMRRRRNSGEEWGFFSKPEFEGLMNKIEVLNSTAKNSYSMSLDYSNMWGKVPIIGMRAAMPKLSQLFRQGIDSFGADPLYEYTTFPRIGLTRKLAITMMLWQNLKDMTLEALPRNLLDRNPDLKGGLKVLRCKKFKSSDLDVRGEPMNGVRLVQLDTDQDFRDSLYWFPRTYRFGLGCGRVIIRGGERIEDGTKGGTKQPNRPYPGRSDGKDRGRQTGSKDKEGNPDKSND